MPWIKDATSQAPKIVYTAPAEVAPMLRVIYDPNGVGPARWLVEYDYFANGSETVADVEALMGL